MPGVTKPETCSLMGCGKAFFARNGLDGGREVCRRHYDRYRTAGRYEPHQFGISKTCSTPDCGREAVAKGLCPRCRKRLQDHGSVADPIRRERARCNASQQMDGTAGRCPRTSHAKGYCAGHYQRLRKTGSVYHRKTRSGEIVEAAVPSDCKVPGCEEPHRSRGYCKTHYERVRIGLEPVADQNRPPVIASLFMALDGPWLSMTAEERAQWAAGFLDGEGCFRLDPLSRRTSARAGIALYTPAISASQIRPEPLVRLQHLLGGKVYEDKRRTSTGNVVWTWKIAGGRRSRKALALVCPHLVVRAQTASVLLAFAEQTRPYGSGRRRDDAEKARHCQAYDSHRDAYAREQAGRAHTLLTGGLSQAYIAGLVDAEACISSEVDSSGLARPYVSLTSGCPDVMAALADEWGGRLYVRRAGRRRREFFTLTRHGRSLGEILLPLLPYLSRKRHQAEMAIEMASLLGPGARGSNNSEERLTIHQSLRSMNSRRPPEKLPEP